MQLHRSCNIGVWQQYQQQQQMNSSKRAMGVPGRPQPKHRSHIAAAAVKSTGAVVAADQLLKLQGIQSKAAGALLAAMCGNALGAQVEPEKVRSETSTPYCTACQTPAQLHSRPPHHHCHSLLG